MGDPEVNLGGGGVEGRVGEGTGGVSHPIGGGSGGPNRENVEQMEAKRYNLECKSSLCNPFKLRCFSSKIAQNIFIYCQEIPLILLHYQ